MVDVCLPGTGGMLPLVRRYLTCCWIEVMGKAILIDCGEGTQIALSASDCKTSRLECLLITHFHADHISGLPGLMLTLGNQGKTTPLVIAGPKGLGKIVSSLLVIAQKLPFEIIIKELSFKECESFDIAGLKVETLPLKHKVACLGYSVTYAAIDEYILNGNAHSHDAEIIRRYHSTSEHKRRMPLYYGEE